ncbi:hypothetical protein VNO80_15162 [Phaseolus coccineus]|uniref:Uncharacterized protein n=1 Tax=Phaseolus coccineus TaxID=3886 RepID=A0AAN9MQX9_PHACN
MEETTKRVGFSRINGPFGVPEKPEFSIGLDAPLSKVKMELLNGPKSIVVLTGFGGSRKTTLATGSDGMNRSRTMNDKDTKCLISKDKQDMMPRTPDPETMFLPTKTIFGILVMDGISVCFEFN